MTLTTPSRAEDPARLGVPAAAATRSRRLGWRNPRLILGLVLVAGSVLLGARLLAAADDTVGVWALTRDLPAGAALDRSDLERRQVRFPDEATADRYLAATATLPDGATLDRPVSGGELLTRSSFAGKDEADLVELPLGVVSDDLPATVRQGSVVDVWVTPKVSGVSGTSAKAVRVLSEVVVVAVPRAADTLAPQSTRQVIVGVPPARAQDVATALGGVADGRVVIARVG